jgi:hypothetical protein
MGYVREETVDAREACGRCAAQMEWRHGTWQCPRCRFKLGCCEGEPQRPDVALASQAGCLHESRD